MTIRKSSAFTLMEIIVVLGILAFLMYIFGGKIKDFLAGGDVSKTKMKIARIQDAVTRYRQEVGKYPPNLEALYEKPKDVDARKWIGPYLTDPDAIVDAWLGDIEYNCPPKRYLNNPYRRYEIISYGADGQEGGTGVNAEQYEGQ